MSGPKRPEDSRHEGETSRPSRERQEPGWAKGLRKLYNSVVEEPLPDSFNELLKKLDDGKNG